MAYAKPSGVTLTSTTGWGTSTCTVKVTASTSYNGYYVYVGGAATSYKYWKKGTISSGSCSVTFDQDSSYTGEKYMNFILSDTDYGSSSITIGNEYSSYLYSYQVPRQVCKIYNGSSSVSTYDSGHHPLPSTLQKSGYTLIGFTTSSSSYSPMYDPEWSDDLNGKTLYAIHMTEGSDTSKTVYYYLGTSTQKSTTLNTSVSESYLYGKGSTIGGTAYAELSTEPSTANYNTSYIFQGWATSTSSTTVSYTDATTAYRNGYSTIYAVYKKSSSSSSGYAYYYRGTGTQQSVSKTTTTSAAYRYGKGSTSGGSTSTSYGTPTTSHASDTSYTFQGWATSSSSSTVYSTTASTAWEASSTIYGVYKKVGSTSNSDVYYYRGTNTRQTGTKTTTVADTLCYGTGTTSGGGATYSYSTPTITHLSDSTNYTFLGWATNANTYTSYNNSASTQWGTSSTIYGVYSKTDSMTYYPQNETTTALTASTTNYSYGTGLTTSNVPTEPTVTYEGYNLLGWADTSSGTPETWLTQWNDGSRTVYAIWKVSTIPIQIHNGTNYVNYAVYIHNGTDYIKVIPYVHNGTEWKQLKSQ